MLKNKFFPFVTFTLLLMSAGVMAITYNNEDNWDVEGLNGGITVSATLTESPCSLAPESTEQHLDMGNIPQWRLSKIGALSAPFPVHLVLENCSFSGQVRSSEHGGNLYYLTDQPVVVMQFIGNAEPTDLRLFRINSESKGIALRLEDSDHNIVLPGERTRPQILEKGLNDLVFNAQLSRTVSDLHLGDFNTVISVCLEYY